MPTNWYTNRESVKDALGIAATATGPHAQLDAAQEGVARLIDDYLGFHAYPVLGTRYYTAKDALRLYLDTPLLGITALRTSTGNASFGTTLSSGDYFLVPYNATEESPRQPWWEIEIRTSATAVFPNGLQRAVQVVGTWGYFDERTTSTNKLTTALTSGALTMDITGASALRVGQTLLIDNEQVTIAANGLGGSDTATTSGHVTIERAKNGTSNDAHTSGTTISLYGFPVIERAAFFQVLQDFRAKEAPLGFAGGEPFGTQGFAPGGAGLHPFARRMLDPLRRPVTV